MKIREGNKKQSFIVDDPKPIHPLEKIIVDLYERIRDLEKITKHLRKD